MSILINGMPMQRVQCYDTLYNLIFVMYKLKLASKRRLEAGLSKASVNL